MQRATQLCLTFFVHGDRVSAGVENHRRAGLDALRGLGACLVLLLHLQCATQALPLFQRGYLAVDMFFILSGFVIGQRYDEALTRRVLTVRSYVRRRLARIYPIIFMGLALGVAAALTSDENSGWQPQSSFRRSQIKRPPSPASSLFPCTRYMFRYWHGSRVL